MDIMDFMDFMDEQRLTSNEYSIFNEGCESFIEMAKMDGVDRVLFLEVLN